MPNVYHRFSLPPCAGEDFSKSPSKTQQQYKHDCDINVMVRRFVQGDMSVCRRDGHIIDTLIPGVSSLHDLVNIQANADTAWQSLPDPIKQSYGNKERFVEALLSASSRKSDKIDDTSVSKETVSPSTDTVTSTPSSSETSPKE